MTNALTCATSLKSDRQVACCTLLLQCAHLHSSANTDLQLQTYTLQRQFIFLSCKNGGPFCNNNVSLQWQNSFLFLQLAKLIATLQLQKKNPTTTTTTKNTGARASSLLFCNCKEMLQKWEALQFVAPSSLSPVQNCLLYLLVQK